MGKGRENGITQPPTPSPHTPMQRQVQIISECSMLDRSTRWHWKLSVRQNYDDTAQNLMVKAYKKNDI